MCILTSQCFVVLVVVAEVFVLSTIEGATHNSCQKQVLTVFSSVTITSFNMILKALSCYTCIYRLLPVLALTLPRRYWPEELTARGQYRRGWRIRPVPCGSWVLT